MSTSSQSCLIRRTIGRMRDVCGNDAATADATGFEFALTDRIAEVNPDHWDRVAGRRSFFLSRAYLSVLDTAGPGHLRQRYGIVLRGPDPVAVVAAQVIEISGRELMATEQAIMDSQRSRGMASRLKKAAQDRAVALMGGRLVVCGNFLSTGLHGVAFAPQEDPGTLWPVAVEALDRIARDERANYLVIKDLSAEEAGCTGPLRRLRFHPLATEPNMILDLAPHWRSHDDYVRDLRAKYRKAAFNVFESIEQAGCAVERMGCVADPAERLHALYMQVERKARVSFAAFPPEYLAALERAAGPDAFRCTVVRHRDDFLGFMIMLKDGDTATAHYAGLDYAANARLPVYFRLLHAAIADAIDWRCRRIAFGRTASEPKARLGARPVPMASWVRHRRRSANIAVRALTSMIAYEHVPERHPFRGPLSTDPSE